MQCGCTINNNRIPYLKMHRNQADYNEITKKLKSNINYVIIYKNGNTAAAIPTLNAQNINMAHQSGLSVGVWTLIPGQSWNYWTNRGTNVITIGSNLHGV